MGCKIFISYKRKTSDDFAYRLHESFKQCGFEDQDVFYDFKTLDNAEDFPEAIRENIENCTDYVLVLSPGSLDGCQNEEDWVRKEIQYAIKYNRHILLAMKSDFEFPSVLPKTIESVRDRTALNFPSNYFDEAFQRLLIRLHSIRDIDLESEKRIQEEANAGNIVMKNELALREEMGTIAIAEDPAKARKDFEEITANLPAACYNVGDIYDKCYNDPALLSKYEITIPINRERDEFLLAQAKDYYTAAGDYAPALYRLGVMKERDGDLDGAFELYKKAAEKEFAPALNAVGYFYQHGLVEETATDLDCMKKAEDVFRKAAEKGLTAAIYNLAKMREDHENDIDITVREYKKALFGEPEVPQAAYALGKIYENKKDDLISARHYYQLAVEGGFYKAQKEIDRLTLKIKASR